MPIHSTSMLFDVGTGDFVVEVDPNGTTLPVGLTQTGDPAFCSIWTLCGLPAVTLPLLQGANGMPMGVQLVGQAGDDGRLLRTARWLALKLSQAA